MLKPDIRLISDAAALDAHRDRILATDALGLDTEFVRERTYYPYPGLLQLSDGELVWIVDPVALADDPGFRSMVAELTGSDSITKILHSTGEDLEVIDLLAGQPAAPSPLFDTQRAAALLGWPLQVRYEVLAQDLLGIEFPGGLGRNNWLRRPLPEAWVAYAAHDVIGLPAMHDALIRRLEEVGRMAWLIEDCERIVWRDGGTDSPLARMRGAAGLDDEQLERLDRLVRWRDRQARKRNLPRGFVVRDEALIELVRPDSEGFEAIVRQARGLSKSDRQPIQTLLEEPASGEFSRPAELNPLSAAQRQELKSMQAHVRQVAESLGVEPPLLASRRDLTRLLQGGKCDWLDGWRGELLDFSGSSR